MQINPIHSILIANRGEIASRIIRTCRKMGIKSIAVFSDADSEALFVKEADVAVHIGESNPVFSYLNQTKMLEVAQAQGADAIHPGYGFLAENAAFAQACEDAGIIFIGPHPKAIQAMGSKAEAKAIMEQHAVPVIPGYKGKDQSSELLEKEANRIGFPLLLKASAGGGGKGMRIVHAKKELKKAIDAAKREALAAFGDDELIIEKYIANGRHIEFQIFGDKHGNAIHILERECSIQRRYQKILEESPSPALDEALREQIGAAAVQAAKALNYDNAGTVEFIFDDESKSFYFLEVNTRLQVEHPVTEEITGLDLVQMQIEVAEGRELTLSQADVKSNGYAIEARLYAEDAANGFMPATGDVYHWEVPQVDGLRVETAVNTGSSISIHYDPMIAKLIVHDRQRLTAHRKMAYVLRHLKCLGLTTNQDFLLHLFEQEAIQKGDYDTHFIQNHIDLESFAQKSVEQKVCAAIGLTLFGWYAREQSRTLLRALPSGWRNSPYMPQQQSWIAGEEEILVQYEALRDHQFTLQIADQSHQMQLVERDDSLLRFRIDGVQREMTIVTDGKDHFIFSPETGNMTWQEKDRFPQKEVEKIKGGFEAPMPSQVIKVLVEPGQAVKAGEGLIVISSMKMENTIEADQDGLVEEIYVQEGQNVAAGFMLLKVRTESRE
jgi:3-methylcrotonyl-CoA carboxylase alpha subunit